MVEPFLYNAGVDIVFHGAIWTLLIISWDCLVSDLNTVCRLGVRGSVISLARCYTMSRYVATVSLLIGCLSTAHSLEMDHAMHESGLVSM